MEVGSEDISLELSIEMEDGEYVLIKKLVDEYNCNPLRTWINLGSPAYPSKSQLELIKECAHPRITTERFKVTENRLKLVLELSSNALCYFELQQIHPETDRGLQPELIREML